MNRSILPYLLLFCTAVLWGSGFVGSKLAVHEVPATVAAMFRFLFGAIFLFSFLKILEKKIRVNRKQLAQLSLLGMVGIGGYNLLFFWGLTVATASDSSMIIPTTTPILTVLVSFLFLKEQLRLKQTLGLFLAILGSFVFFWGIFGHGTLDLNRLLGDFAFIGSAASWVFFTMFGNRIFHQMDILVSNAYATLAGAVFLFFCAIPDLPKVDWGHLGTSFWITQIYLGIFPSGLGNWFYSIGVKTIGSTRASVFMYLVPVFGLLLSILILGETITFLQVLGGIFMITGVWFVNQKKGKEDVHDHHRQTAQGTSA